LIREETGILGENPQVRLRKNETQAMYNDCRGGKGD